MYYLLVTSLQCVTQESELEKAVGRPLVIL